MKYIGIDLHRDFFVAVAQDISGNLVLKERFGNSVASVGTIRIETAGKGSITMLKHVDDPNGLAAEINNLIAEARKLGNDSS